MVSPEGITESAPVPVLKLTFSRSGEVFSANAHLFKTQRNLFFKKAAALFRHQLTCICFSFSDQNHNRSVHIFWSPWVHSTCFIKCSKLYSSLKQFKKCFKGVFTKEINVFQHVHKGKHSHALGSRALRCSWKPCFSHCWCYHWNKEPAVVNTIPILFVSTGYWSNRGKINRGTILKPYWSGCCFNHPGYFRNALIMQLIVVVSFLWLCAKY